MKTGPQAASAASVAGRNPFEATLCLSPERASRAGQWGRPKSKEPKKAEPSCNPKFVSLPRLCRPKIASSGNRIGRSSD